MCHPRRLRQRLVVGGRDAPPDASSERQVGHVTTDAGAAIRLSGRAAATSKAGWLTRPPRTGSPRSSIAVSLMIRRPMDRRGRITIPAMRDRRLSTEQVLLRCRRVPKDALAVAGEDRRRGREAAHNSAPVAKISPGAPTIAQSPRRAPRSPSARQRACRPGAAGGASHVVRDRLRSPAGFPACRRGGGLAPASRLQAPRLGAGGSHGAGRLSAGRLVSATGVGRG
jgi:hypothetical protein